MRQQPVLLLAAFVTRRHNSSSSLDAGLHDDSILFGSRQCLWKIRAEPSVSAEYLSVE